MDTHEQFKKYVPKLKELIKKFDKFEENYTEWELFFEFMKKLIHTRNDRIRECLLLLFFDDRDPLHTNLENMIAEIDSYSNIQLNRLVYSEYEKNIVVDYKNERSKRIF